MELHSLKAGPQLEEKGKPQNRKKKGSAQGHTQTIYSPCGTTAAAENDATTLLRLLSVYYGEQQRLSEFHDLRRRALARLEAVAKRLGKRRADFEAQLAAADEAKVGALRKKGDLLTAYAHTWNKGNDGKDNDNDGKDNDNVGNGRQFHHEATAAAAGRSGHRKGGGAVDDFVVAYDFETGEEIKIPLSRVAMRERGGGGGGGGVGSSSSSSSSSGGGFKGGGGKKWMVRSPMEEAAAACRKAAKLSRSLQTLAPPAAAAAAQESYARTVLADVQVVLDECRHGAGDLDALKEICEEIGLFDGGGGGSVNGKADFEDFTRVALKGVEGNGGGDFDGAGAIDRNSKANEQQQQQQQVKKKKNRNKKGSGSDAKKKNTDNGKGAAKQTPPVARGKGQKLSPSSLEGLLVLGIPPSEDDNEKYEDAPPSFTGAASSEDEDDDDEDDDDEEGGGAGGRSGSGSGWNLVVGRNSRQNDRVTFSVARPADRWFHARGVPGAHVLLRRGPHAKGSRHDEQPSQRDLQAAADVAAFLSKARGHGRAFPVSVASPKYLRRPKGAPPGAVVILQGHEEVLDGDPRRGADFLDRAAAGLDL